MNRFGRIGSWAAVVLLAASIPAYADTITTNTWYAGGFGGVVGDPLKGGGTPGTNGPILPSGTASGVSLPITGAVITLPDGGYLTVTDNLGSGDQFALDVNGSPAAPAVGNPSGLSPGGQQALAGGFTSVPVPNVAQCFLNISCALSNADFSSGTFLLPAGTDTLTGTLIATIGPGGFDLIVEPAAAAVPEPSSFAVLVVGLLGLGLLRRRKGHGALYSRS